MDPLALSPRTDPRADELLHELFVDGVADPYPHYEQLRELGDGVHWIEAVQGFAVFRYDDVRAIGADPGLFSSDIFWVSPQATHDPANPAHVRFVDVASRLFMLADPPVHSRIRSIFRHAFTGQAIQKWRPMVEQVTAGLLQSWAPGQEFDLMQRLAAQLPVAVIATMLGVPEEHRNQFRRWSTAFATSFDPTVQGDGRDRVITHSLELMDFLGDLVTSRRETPADDLTSLLVHTATDTGDYLSDIDLVSQLTLLLAAGNETTTNLIGSGLSLLFDHPEARAILLADPGAVPKAVEEMLRFDPPIQFTWRKTTRPTQLGSTVLPADTLLVPCIASANRDPRRFPDPLAFDVTRKDNKHLSFFHGVHFCVGAPLARLEATTAFRQLLAAFPGIAAGSEPGLRSTRSTTRGWDTRPVRL